MPPGEASAQEGGVERGAVRLLDPPGEDVASCVSHEDSHGFSKDGIGYVVKGLSSIRLFEFGRVDAVEFHCDDTRVSMNSKKVSRFDADDLACKGLSPECTRQKQEEEQQAVDEAHSAAILQSIQNGLGLSSS